MPKPSSQRLRFEIEDQKPTAPLTIAAQDKEADTFRPEEGDASLDHLLVPEEEETRELCRQKMAEVITALNNREFLPGKFFIPPSIFLLPFPEIYSVEDSGKGQQKKVRIKVYSFDLQDEVSALDEIVTQLLSLPHFRDLYGISLERNETFNLIKALTEFFYEFIYGFKRTEPANMVADYEVTVKTFDKLPFVPAKTNAGQPYTFVKSLNKRKPSPPIVVDQQRIDEFKKFIMEKFDRKDKEIKGRLNQVRADAKAKIGMAAQDGSKPVQKTTAEARAASFSNHLFRKGGANLTGISDAFKTDVGPVDGSSDVRKMSAEKRLVYEQAEKIINLTQEIAKLFSVVGVEFEKQELAIIGSYILDPKNHGSPLMLAALMSDLKGIDKNLIIRKMNELRDLLLKIKVNPVSVRLLISQFFGDPNSSVESFLLEQLVEEIEKNAKP